MATAAALLPARPLSRSHVRLDASPRAVHDTPDRLADIRASIERLRREREVLFEELRRVCSA